MAAIDTLPISHWWPRNSKCLGINHRAGKRTMATILRPLARLSRRLNTREDTAILNHKEHHDSIQLHDQDSCHYVNTLPYNFHFFTERIHTCITFHSSCQGADPLFPVLSSSRLYPTVSLLSRMLVQFMFLRHIYAFPPSNKPFTISIKAQAPGSGTFSFSSNPPT